ncbi:MAG: PilN domain-containing protein [Acidobacteriota bacterium]|nr:PilN domain-containing protein [Acidobacteriota bacterium]
MPKVTTDGPSPLVTGLAVLVICGLGLYYSYSRMETQHEKLQTDLIEANRNIVAMNKVKQAYLERQKEYEAVKRRFDVIDQLRNSQTGPVTLLSQLSDTVNKTDGVWLLTMKDDGPTVTLDGVALGPVNVANLMANLKKSGYYKNVELRDTSEDDAQKIQTFTFSLVCEKAKA